MNRHRSKLDGPLLGLAVLLAPCAFADDAALEEIRPFDKVVLKNGNSIEGIIDTPGDPKLLPEIEVRYKGGSGKLKIKGSEIDSVVPRRTADIAYSEWQKSVQAEHDAEARARAELKLGLWAKAPNSRLEGAAPRQDAALRHFLNAVELDPKLAEAYPHILAALADAAPDGPTDGRELDLEAHVATLAGSAGRSEPELDFRLGMAFAQRPELRRQAIPFLERLLASGYKNQGQLRRARAALGDIYVAERSPQKALAIYEKAVVEPASSPANFEPFLEMAKLQARSGELDGLRAARELFAKALAIQPDYLEIPGELAALDYRVGNLAEAEKTLKAAASKDPASIALQADLALVRIRQGKFQLAEKALAELLPKADRGDRARIQLGLGILKENKGDDAGSLAAYRQALEEDPGSTEARVSLAAILVRLKELGEARTIAEELLPAGKDNPWLFAAASRILGEADLAEGKTDSALAHFLRAIEVDSRDPALLERTGLLLERHGKLDPGYAMLRRARAVGGDRPDTLNGMAYYHYTRGEFDTAGKFFEQVINLVKPPAKASEKKGARPAPARVYALQGKALIADLKRLEVWSADFTGPDSPTLNGWELTTRNGVEIARKGGRAVVAGRQAGDAEAVTQAMLERPVDASSFERLAMAFKVDSGKVRVALRLDGSSARGGASTGLVFFKDYDGVLRCQLKTSMGNWEPLPKTEDLPPEGTKTVNPETTSWPQDGGVHVIEVRRAGGPVPGSTTARTASGFDLYFDGQPVAWNVRITGLTGRTYYVGFSGQTDGLGNEYGFTVESFKIYRNQPARRTNAKF